jgi:hypothetical protein
MIFFGAIVSVVAYTAGEKKEDASDIRVTVVGSAWVSVIAFHKGVFSRDHAETA